MKRIPRWPVVLALLLVGLTACQPATPEATEPPPPTATATAVPTSTSVPPTATPVPSPTTEPPPAEATRKPVADPEATPTRPWQIPSLMDGDHGKGNPDAGLVLVEYSDFQ